MRYLEIAGRRPLCGELTIQGSKNAALPVLTACLLGDGPCIIDNCPQIQDVEDTLAILRMLGCKTERTGHTVSVDPSGMEKTAIFGPQAERIRSSVLFLGALLGRMGEAALPYPGGCAIGSRPIDYHLRALEKLGVRFSKSSPSGASGGASFRQTEGSDGEDGSGLGSDGIYASATRLRGAGIRLPQPSVGATENTILAAVLADGETVIENAALEPEIDELCRFLNLRGAKIRRERGRRIRIFGKQTLGPVRYRLDADRIVAGSYLLAGAACGGSIHFRNLPAEQLSALLAVLSRMGVQVAEDGRMCAGERPLAVENIATAPYPGFPTDLQSPLMAALGLARGESRIWERMFENRFRTAACLRKMGADITIEGSCARIKGTATLRGGAEVRAPDLRGGAALVTAALAASGRSRIEGYEYIARGYEDICRDFQSLGAEIRLTEDRDEKVW
ncbi:MAG: UDP-N-acetylglucosamine 1-carboxyvinyltransferase [Lachnospiraceae bacterium]|nr:UDP-N-acetylglucosamine 1-carboxyvinyltransferase [Lachnospiraceae bacterium]